MRRILHLNAGNETGGGMFHILSLLKHFNRDEFVLGVFEQGELLDRANDFGIETVYFPNQTRWSFSLLRDVCRYIKEKKINCIHTHGPRANVYANMIKRYIRAHWIVTVHSDPFQDFKGKGVTGKLFTRLNVSAIKNADRIIAVSNHFQGRLHASGVKEDKIITAFNGIDFNKKAAQCHLRKDFGVDDHAFLFLKVARFERVKGHEIALRAFSDLVKKCANCHFLFVGDGPLLQTYKETVRELGLENNVHFLGYRKDVERFYEMADITMLASHSEGFPLVLLESARAKTPVITTNVGGVKQLVKNNSLGWITEPGNVTELSSAMEEAFHLQQENKLRQVGEKLHHYASTEFSLENFAENIYNVYLSMNNAN